VAGARTIAIGLAAGIDLFSPWVAVLAGATPTPHIDNKNGWRGYVFPAYVNALAREGRYAPLLHCLAQPRFWRGVPKTSLANFVYLMKQAYWSWSTSRARRLAARNGEHRA